MGTSAQVSLGTRKKIKKENLEVRDFASRAFDSPKLLETMITKIKGAALVEPYKISDGASKITILKWELKVKKHFHREAPLEEEKILLIF